MNKEKIFISHSSKDIIIVKSFVENVLILGLDIHSDRIFCTSMEGHGVKSGQYIPDRLREEINISSIALLFISRSYKSSEICLNEVGAAWATLRKENVIPLLLPDIDFSELGFLDFGRIGIKIYEKSGVFKLVQDCKEELNPSFNLAKFHDKAEVFLGDIKPIKGMISKSDEIGTLKYDEWTECFTNNLYVLDEIIRRAIPANADGIYRITDEKIQNQVFSDLSKTKFLEDLWYKQAEGDFYVKNLKKLNNGNWIISSFGWEVKISDMWISLNSELQYEFILFQSKKQKPFKIDSDIGGVSYNVGVLKDGTIVSENERLNGFAKIGGESIDLYEFGIEPRYREDNSHWVFIVSDYHKAGFNADETIDFCKKLDSGEVEVNQKNILQFLRKLRNNPVVRRWR